MTTGLSLLGATTDYGCVTNPFYELKPVSLFILFLVIDHPVKCTHGQLSIQHNCLQPESEEQGQAIMCSRAGTVLPNITSQQACRPELEA